MFLRSCWEQRGHPLEDDLPDPAGEINDALSRADLASLLDRLPAVSRTVLWLHEVEGYTHREIAGLLDKTPSFSKSQLARSYVRLRMLVAEDATQDEVVECMPKSAS